MRRERGGRGLAGTWTVALVMAVLVLAALVDSAPVILKARPSMGQASGSAHFT